MYFLEHLYDFIEFCFERQYVEPSSHDVKQDRECPGRNNEAGEVQRSAFKRLVYLTTLILLFGYSFAPYRLRRLFSPNCPTASPLHHFVLLIPGSSI